MSEKQNDPMQRPVSPELEMLMPVLAETMKFATQALRQSVALGEILVAKGIVTRKELNVQLQQAPDAAKKLLDLLEQNMRKMQ